MAWRLTAAESAHRTYLSAVPALRLRPGQRNPFGPCVRSSLPVCPSKGPRQPQYRREAQCSGSSL
ncbi:hypothetical protein J31TS4_10170 [Paenibacillus sp. J31TS4]|nr:hypothetical protein J31TS4_10170 [Paenibacillus sp. J31TS4]